MRFNPRSLGLNETYGGLPLVLQSSAFACVVNYRNK